MLETRLYTYGGFNAVAPVYWARQDAPPRRTSTSTLVKIGDLRGWAFTALARRQAPLACLIATTLPNDLSGVTLVAVEDAGAGLWWAHIFRDGTPIEGAEQVFFSQGDFDNHLAAAARSGELQQAAFCPSIIARLPSLWENPVTIEPAQIEPQDAPLFVSPLSLAPATRRKLRIGGLGLGLATTLGLTAWALIAPASAPTPVLVDVHRTKDPALFVKGCVDALGANWPSPLNWTLTKFGCFDKRLQDNRDLSTLKTETGAFASYRLEPGFNPQTARIIARYALNGLTEDAFAFDDTTLIVTLPFDNPFQVSAMPPAPNPALYNDVERALVGQVISIKRSSGDDLITIRTMATPEAILPRLSQVSGLEIRALETVRDVTEIQVGGITVQRTREVKTP